MIRLAATTAEIAVLKQRAAWERKTLAQWLRAKLDLPPRAIGGPRPGSGRKPRAAH